MNTLTIALFFALAALAMAKPSGWGHGHDDGHWDAGRWGDHGNSWDGGHGGDWDDGSWNGGHWDDGSWDDGSWGGHGGHSDVVVGHGATLVGPSALGHGGGWGGAWGGHGGHGVVVAGPHTVPATIVGPAGKVHADGLYGVGHGHGGHGHW